MRSCSRRGASFSGSLLFGTDDHGSASLPILVAAYGEGRATSDAGTGDGLYALNSGGFVVANLNFVGSGPSSNSGSGVQFDTNLPGDAKLEHVYIDHVDASGFRKFGVTVGGSNGKSGFRDVRVTYVNASNNATGGIETHGVFSSSSAAYANEDVYVNHSNALGNLGYANSSNHVGDGIVLSDVNRAVIERCLASDNGALNTHVGGPVGIWAWDANAVTIQNNESHHNHTNSKADGGGFDLDGGVTNSVMQYNYSHDNDGAGYLLGQFSGARAFNHNVVRYNISANDGRKNGYAGIQLWNGGSGISDCEIHNNTVSIGPASSGTPRGIYFQTGTKNVHVRNNIFQTTGGVRIADIQAKQSGLLFQGNDYLSSGAAFSVKQFAKTYSSLVAWRNSTGQEKLNGAAVGMNVDPKLVNPGWAGTVGNPDSLESMSAFRLDSGSTLVNAGLNLWTLFALDPGPRDFFATGLHSGNGTPQPNGSGFDVGANELT